MFETNSFAAAKVPGVGVSAAIAAPMTFGARRTTETTTVMERANGTFDPARQVVMADGAPLAHQLAERTPYNTVYDSQEFVDKEA